MIRASFAFLLKPWRLDNTRVNRFKEAQQLGATQLQLRDLDPLIRRVSLRDVTRAEDHAGNPAAGQHGGIAKIMQTDGAFLASLTEKLFHERQLRVRLQR